MICGHTPGGEPPGPQHAPLDRPEDQQLDPDADDEDEEDRGDHARHVRKVASVLEVRAEAVAQQRARRDDLRRHQRAPGERPALLAARDVAGQSGGQQDVARAGEPARTEHLPHPRQDGRDLVDPRHQAVRDRRDRAREHHEVDRGVGEPEPQDGGGHPGHRREALQTRQDRPDRGPHRPHLGDQQPERGRDDQRDREPDERPADRRPEDRPHPAVVDGGGELVPHRDRRGHLVLARDRRGPDELPDRDEEDERHERGQPDRERAPPPGRGDDRRGVERVEALQRLGDVHLGGVAHLGADVTRHGW